MSGCGSNSYSCGSKPASHCTSALRLPLFDCNATYAPADWVCHDNGWYRSKIDNVPADNPDNEAYPPEDRMSWDGPFTMSDLVELLFAGVAGAPGSNGADGADGADGASAYDIWLAAGNAGTQADFLDSLVGAPGADGANGSNGVDGQATVVTVDGTELVTTTGGTETGRLDVCVGCAADTVSSPAISGPTSVAAGSSITLSVTPGTASNATCAPVTTTWTLPNGSNTTAASVNVTGTTNGATLVYSAVSTDSCGNSSPTVTHNVSVTSGGVVLI